MGLGLLGYVGWQLLGTTWVAQHRAEELVTGLRTGWAAEEPTVVSGSSTAFAVVRIPRFGAEFQVPLVEGTTPDTLASGGLGRLEGTARPGGRGNLVLAGHRVTHGEPLRRMPELVPGDRVVIEQADRVDTYVLDTGGADLVVPFTDTWVADARPEPPADVAARPSGHPRLLTLVTCAELFHTDDRLVAFGHLVSSTRR
ncbi:MAG TPA: sortase [Marmoricola sp.]|nr:sortase [Marmoricola sp.]